MRIEGTVSISELFEFMREKDLVIVPREAAKADQLRERYLQKKSLTYKEISDSHLWGRIGKKAVETIAKKYLDEDEVFQKGNAYRIRITAVERIAKNRGTL